MNRLNEKKAEYNDLKDIGNELWGIVKLLDPEARKKVESIRDRIWTIECPNLQLVDELIEAWREKEYAKETYKKDYYSLIEAHLEIYGKEFGETEKEELLDAIIQHSINVRDKE